MANEHLILCGGAKLSSRKQPWNSAKPLELRINDDPGRINCKITDISEKLRDNLKDVEFDLLDIASYVYGADQATSRGGNVLIDYGKAWYRNFRFEIPVRCPDFWSAQEVQNDLTRTLNDLSGDNFEFSFSKLSKGQPKPSYFEWGTDESTDVEAVMLFSGGLDSLGGAVEEILIKEHKVVLVSHRANPKIDARQKRLVKDIATRVKRHFKPYHVPVWVNKDKELNKEYTQRTRSFLFASIASVVARMFGVYEIRFYENGVTSLNLPISPQVVSTRASRTTHPRPLASMRALFSRVYSKNYGIVNPFIWKTKTQILKDIKSAGNSELCASTVSCAHTWEMTNIHPHCGKCSQCLDRRLVALAAGYGEKEDPAELYKFNIFEGSLEGIDRILFESYVEIVNRIQKTDNAVQFCTMFPEVSRALNHMPDHTDQTAEAIFRMYKDHADEVTGAIDARGKQSFPRLRRGELPADCLLSIAAAGLRSIGKPTEVARETGVREAAIQGSRPSNNGRPEALVINESTFSVTWQGKGPIELGCRREFRLLTLLAASKNSFVTHVELLQGLGSDDQDKIAHTKCRMVKLLKAKELDELAECIKSQVGHYGLFIS